MRSIFIHVPTGAIAECCDAFKLLELSATFTGRSFAPDGRRVHFSFLLKGKSTEYSRWVKASAKQVQVMIRRIGLATVLTPERANYARESFSNGSSINTRYYNSARGMHRMYRITITKIIARN